MKLNYVVKGSVRGEISRHRKLSAAIRAMRRDEKRCASLGGGAYSDAEILRVDGEPLTDAEVQEMEAAK